MKGSQRTTPLRTILQNCLAHIDNLEATRAYSDRYEKEFQDLKQFSENLKSQKEYACTEGEKEINRKKNRYKDILPFNASRVVLAELPDTAGSNYVNANFIKGASGSKTYIASQGPLPNTVNDFWRMVVECEVQIIVMACNEEEAGKHKCEHYWLEQEGEERTYGMVDIKLVKANVICADYSARTMLLTYINDQAECEERTVCQFHYSTWPDHGVPPLVRPLLDMVRLMRDTQKSETLPVLVHCSAGCGRTGTICAIDFVRGLLRLGKLSKDFSVYNLVRDMRKQRVAMVQTKEQYILVHQAVRELFQEQLNLIDANPYANITLSGEPFLTEAIQPIYESLPLRQDTPEQLQDGNKAADNKDMAALEPCLKNAAAAPLPKKKSQVPSSKHEKEAENLSRSTASLNAACSVEPSPSNTVARIPKIAKFKALFERSPNHDRSGSKTKSHTVSRSHSLGPVRNPLQTELFKPLEPKPAKTGPAIQSGGKLKVPKVMTTTTVITRPVPHIKRSKSLKVPKETTPLLTLLQFASNEELADERSQPSTSSQRNDQPSTSQLRVRVDCPVTQMEVQRHLVTKNESLKKGRSLESLLGDAAAEMTYLQYLNTAATQRDQPPQPSAPPETVKPRSSLSFKQMLSNASHRTMHSLASGLGIRERRNSFRQAVSKEESVDRIGEQFGTEGRFVPVPEDSASSVFVDGSSRPPKETLTVRSQNGEILNPGSKRNRQESSDRAYQKSDRHEPTGDREHTRRHTQPESKDTQISSQSMRLPSRNRFLFRLNTELQNSASSEVAHSHVTSKSVPIDQRYGTATAIKSFKSDRETDGHRQKPAASSSRSRGHYLLGFGGFRQSSNAQESPANVSAVKMKQHLTRAPALDTNSDYVALKNNLSPNLPRRQEYVSLEDTKAQMLNVKRHHMTLPPNLKSPQHEGPAVLKPLPGICRIRKEVPYVTRDDLYATSYPRSAPQGPQFTRAGKTSSASSQSSDNDYHKTLPECNHSRKMKEIPRPAEVSRLAGDRLKQDLSSESSGSSGARELYSVMRVRGYDSEAPRATTWAAISRSKSTSQALEELSRAQPVAPPRVRRRSSARDVNNVTRHSSLEPLDDPSQNWALSMTSKAFDSRDWTGALGVDLDAIAASMQRKKHPNTGNSLRAVPSETDRRSSGELPLSYPSSPTPGNVRKQQYL